jgi:BirA family transcriptional regulator, biotin operon repressor / biotin---[acetyl-CoA-carboxylase] ligase
VTGFLARRQHLAVVGSTNDVVREWLVEGVPEVCLATADQQTAGRGREGRAWVGPAGSALLLSLGFRPTYLAPDRFWQLPAVISLAMADAAAEVGGLDPGSVGLKWPNDLVAWGDADHGVRKLAGVLGESDGIGSDDPRVVVGIGVNGDWPAASFPTELAGTMTSLRELIGGSVDHGALLEAFLRRLEPAVGALRRGAFDGVAWADRQVTTERDIELMAPDGTVSTARAVGVDPVTGALLVADGESPGGRRAVVVGEIRHVRLARPTQVGV